MKSINGAYADTAALLDYGFNNFTRTAVKTEPETMSVSYLPAEKYILKDYKDCTLCHRYQIPSVTLPNGADISTLNSSRSLCKTPWGFQFWKSHTASTDRGQVAQSIILKPCYLTGLFHLTDSLFCVFCGGSPVSHGVPPLFLHLPVSEFLLHKMCPHLFF